MGDNQKNKLVKLLSRFRFSIMFGTVEVMRWTIPTRDILTALVDYLVAKGVTVQKWTPVTDGMPELIPCDAGTAYSEAVNVLTSGHKVLTAIWDGFDWICDAEFWDAEDEEITHWAPVPLPLPEKPKGE